MEGNDTIKRAVPKINISLSDREEGRLERLCRLRGAKRSRVLAEAVIHMLATIERSEPVHYSVPSEQENEQNEGGER